MKAFLIYIFLVVLSISQLFAQAGQVHFTRVDITRGLSNNQAQSIYRDKKGFVWIGTVNGLNRYDGYDFKVFRNIPNDTNSLSSNSMDRIYPFPNDQLLVSTRAGFNIYDPAAEKFDRNYLQQLQQLGLPAVQPGKCLQDAAGDYWFVFGKKLLCRYHPADRKVTRYSSDPESPVRLEAADVNDVVSGNNGSIWIIYANGIIDQVDPADNKLVKRHNSFQLAADENKDGSSLYTLFIDSRNNCWVSKGAEPLGAYCINTQTGTITHFAREDARYSLRSNIISGITEDLQSNIWIATDHGGISLLEPGGKIRYLVTNAEDNRSISQNSITNLYRDKEGIIWVGTYKQGFNYFNQNLARFPLQKHLANTPSLPFDDVNRFAEDAKGNIWVGTNGGGLIYFDRANDRYRQWMAGPNSISNNVIVSLWIDHDQKLWIGSYFGGLDCFDGKTFTHFKNNPADPSSLSDNRVWEIYEDQHRNLWVGTLNGGLNKFNPATKNFTRYTARPGQPNALQSNYISAIMEDGKGNLWLGTSSGIDVFNPATGSSKHIGHTNSVESLGSDDILCLLRDSRGFVWVGTREGLDLYNEQANTFQHFTVQDGLPHNTILNVLEDNDHKLWVSTSNGLSRGVVLQTPQKKVTDIRFSNYDELNNLQGREFNENAAMKTRSGELIFGGPYGFNIFQPANIRQEPKRPKVVLTGFELFNQPIRVGEKLNNRVLLHRSIAETSTIELKYNQDIFSIIFASLDFSHTEKEKYAYMLEGFNKNWLISDGTQRRATYTNLDPGTYEFRIRPVSSNGEWGEQETRLEIIILPPFWKTTWAYLVYFLMAIGALWLARHLVLRRAHMRFAIVQERKEAQRMHELDLMKIRFITNVSHEFRTPLSLILAPIDKLLKTIESPEQQKQFHLIHRNARRLLNMVNQLLDFRKIEGQEFNFQPASGDIVQFVKDISYSFTDIAEKKHIHFSFLQGIEAQSLSFDADKMEKILFNLLSNAYKFTPEGGSVSVEINKMQTQMGVLELVNCIEIKVTDTGIGIPKDKQDRAFDRFFQVETPGNILNQGSGIGLAIVREFVSLHKGSVSVESEPGRGSCFIVLLPINESAAIEAGSVKEQQVLSEEDTPPIEYGLPELQAVKLRGKRPTILIVEDSEDFRFHLRDSLGQHFRIVEASNGRDGWQKVQEHQPDLVVSDIMMPVMDGLELAKKLKHDPRTAATPVILLTARSTEEQQLEGLDTGVNDYITKPFSPEMLLSRVRNLLAQQKANKKTTRQITVSTADVNLENPDEKAIRDALAIVEKNMSNADFSVEDMSRDMHLSRVGLYKKMVALTGKTPIEFIRDIRLARATQLLEKSEMNIAEIAYEVGFNDPKYFAKTFKKVYGVLPSSYMGKKDLL